MSKRAFTEEQDRQIVIEYTGGKTLRELAAEHGCSAVAVSNSLRRSGCAYRHPSVKRTEWDPDLAEEVLSLHREGWSAAALAHHFVIRRTSIQSLLIERGEKRHRQGGRLIFTPAQHQEIRESYESGLSLRALTRRFDCSMPTIVRAITRAGGETRPPGISGLWTDDVLNWAVKEYQSGRTQQSIAAELGIDPAGVRFHLQQAGVAIRVYVKPPQGKGRVMNGSGYVMVGVPPDDPMFSMTNASGYVLEHRLIMARHLGRPLTAQETVHHINGDHGYNRLENLQLRHGRHGEGVIMVCMDCGSHNIGSGELA
jgi:lambda repressor-like predicted transcriptional regulator